MRDTHPKHVGGLIWAGLALLFLLAFALRIYRLDVAPLRGDEAYSVVHWTTTPFTEAWWGLFWREPHPAGAFILYWLWNGLVGTSVFATRMLSVLGNVMGLAVVITLSRQLLGDWRLVLVVGVLWTINPFLIWHAQDARTYGVLSALTPLTFYWLLRALDKTGHYPGLRPWLPYIILQTLALYLYYLEIFWLAAQGLTILALRQRMVLKRALRAWVIIGVLIIPVVIEAYGLLFISNYQGNAQPGEATALFYRFVPTLWFGFNNIPTLAGVVFVLALVAGLIVLARRDVRTGWLLGTWIFIPSILLLLVSNWSDFFRPRYIVTITPALLIATTAVIALIAGRWRSNRLCRYGLPLLAVAVIAISTVEIWDYYYNDPPKAVDLPGLTAYLQARMQPGDVLVFGSPDPALEYYFTGPGALFFIPLESSVSKRDFDHLLESYDGIFLFTGERTGEAHRYLQANAQPIAGDSYPGLVQFRPWSVNAREINEPLAITFGDIALLRGYSLLGDDDSGQVIMLYWEALEQTFAEYHVLVHLVSATGNADTPPLAVFDHGIADTTISTTAWQPGTLYRDPVPLTLNLPAGEYSLRVGLYESASGERLPIIDTRGEVQADTSLSLVTIVHNPP